MPNWAHDFVLGALEQLPEPGGSLVSAFPGRAESAERPDWIDVWFRALVQLYYAGTPPPEKTLKVSAADSEVLSPITRKPVSVTIRLVSVTPHYFRGFREVPAPINIDADLVVIEGRNSSGKTSLSEALEWLLTGLLSRRQTGKYGSARELAECITNEFRPKGDATWVEAVITIDGAAIRLRRLLLEDYSASPTSKPRSTLQRDGVDLTAEDERELLEELFAAVHPIMMQHTLREFIQSTPDQRRQYFERLLQVDELTALIEKAVVGDSELSDFPHPSASTALSKLRALAASVTTDGARAAFEDLLRSKKKLSPDRIKTILHKAAKEEFPNDLINATSFDEAKAAIIDAQHKAREREFPALKILRKVPSSPPSDYRAIQKRWDDYTNALSASKTAEEAAAAVSDAQRAIASAFQILTTANLIQLDAVADQVCPTCDDDRKTLTPARVRTVQEWQPVAHAVQNAQAAFARAQEVLLEEIQSLDTAAAGAVVDEISKNDFGTGDSTVTDSVNAEFGSVLDLAKGVNRDLLSLQVLTTELRSGIEPTDRAGEVAIEAVEKAAAAVFATETRIAERLSSYQTALDHLETAVGISAGTDGDYGNRELWNDVAASVSALSAEVDWEIALRKAQKYLSELRKALIRVRGEIIEEARRQFTVDLTDVWNKLRRDSGARFSKLAIPAPRGKGFKLEMEVKASISDGGDDVEVDALRVFSESQINVVGIAAYVTRARRLGHSLLILDDPVQSMDEEHFGSFASMFLTGLLDEGLQVIILTHSETFVRLISNWQFERESFATLTSRYSKRRGCCVDEGNRRITERLKIAEHLAEEGRLDEAWRFVRLAIERLYALAMRKANDQFDPETWRNQTAEYMWEAGVAKVITEKIPDAGRRLKEVLVLTTYGAHDKSAPSETDLVAASKYLKEILTPLRLGDG